MIIFFMLLTNNEIIETALERAHSNGNNKAHDD